MFFLISLSLLHIRNKSLMNVKKLCILNLFKHP